ncbi:xanthine dehydrogenase/oxidase [Elysia marginata]|uniref:Xanthine dehydrogenase/oxidase n=1 Tax=Elysia marginata TaxID=1093978 RepID=A0AAV4ITA5_9GAST|nr:xanthine dehydrogenase/oxidase [Elysia marginata]
MSDNRWTKRATEWQPRIGKRSRGRQPLRWSDSIAKAGCDSQGKLVGVKVDIFVDAGHVATTMTFDVISMLDQGYYCPNWEVTMKQYKTNKPCAGPTRGPGQVPACMMIETILEHLVLEARQCPVMFRELNLFEENQKNLFGTTLTHCPLKKMWRRLCQLASVQSRLEAINKYNKANLWRKRGISMLASRYDMCYYPTGFPTHVSVFAHDGTVAVITSGVEMGQGLYMKVAQAVAYSLQIPLKLVKVRPNQNNVTPNPLWTGGSISSERCVASAMIACEKIKAQLQPFREKHSHADWKTLLQAAWEGNADLSAGGMHHYDGPHPDLYATFMAGVVETEVDVLTGESQIARVDLLGDFGESMNPTIDIGQVEGAFVMGLGAYLTEDVFYNKETGQLLSDGTWAEPKMRGCWFRGEQWRSMLGLGSSESGRKCGRG